MVQGPPRPQGTPLYSLAYGVAGGIILSGLVYVRGLGGHQLGEEPSSYASYDLGSGTRVLTHKQFDESDRLNTVNYGKASMLSLITNFTEGFYYLYHSFLVILGMILCLPH